MLPTVSNVPTLNTGEGLSSALRSSLDLLETQDYQTQYLSDNTVVDCGSAEGTAINDFSVELAEVSGTVLAGVKDKKARKDTASHANEQSGFTTAQSSEHYNNEYKCDICDKRFQEISHLQKHKKLHFNIRDDIHHECEKPSYSRKKLTGRQSVHGTYKPFKCETCSKRFKRKALLKQHYVVHSDKHQYLCEGCGKGFKRKFELRCHSSVHSNERPYKCRGCDNDFKSKRALNKHMKQNHMALHDEIESTGTLLKKQNADGGSVINQSHPMIGQPSTSSAHVEKSKTEIKAGKGLDDLYLLNIFPDLPFDDSELDEFCNSCLSGVNVNSIRRYCEECNIHFKRFFLFEQHNIDVHQVRGDFSCKLCEKSFSLSYYLRVHEVDQHPDVFDGRHNCDYCDQKFWNKSKHDDHVLKMHPEETDGKYECTLCKRKYNYPSLLNRHMVRHHYGKAPEKHTCSCCSKVFADPGALEKHQASFRHSDTLSGPHKCEYCDRIFSAFSGLKRHIDDVHPDMPEGNCYQCDYCTESFVNAKKLKYHKSRSHVEDFERKYPCNLCSKIYASSGSLQRHQRGKHFDKTECKFPCPYCKKFFASKSECENHNLLEHVEKKYMCVYCKKLLSTWFALKNHQMNYHGDEAGLDV